MTKPQSAPGTAVPSRRDFIKQSSAVVGAGLAASLVTPGGVHAGADETIRIGLIGCGGRGTGAAAQALSTSGPVKLVAMADAFEDRLEGSLSELQKKEALLDRIDVPVERRFSGFDAYNDVLNSGVDMVILATPPGFRPIHFAAAVEADKHVFMEKPVAVDGPGVRKVLEAAQAAKQKSLAVGVGLQRHHQPPYLETIKRLKDGAIGDIVATRVYWNGAGVWVRPRTEDQTDMEYQMRNWYYFNWLCGDHICEQHIHNLDVSNWLVDQTPVKCWGMGGREVRTGIDNGEIFDHFAVEYEYPDGSRMFSQCRHIPGCWSSVSEHAIGSKGTADISGHRISPNDGDRWRYRGDKPNPYQVEHDDLFAAIRSGASYSEAVNGAHSTLTAIMGRMATYSGKPVSWEDALNSQIDLAPPQYAWDAPAPAPTIAVPGQTVAV